MIIKETVLIGEVCYSLSGYLENQDYKSILNYVENNSENIREKLIDEMHLLNDELYNLVSEKKFQYDEQDLLLLNMSLLYEKSLYKSKSYLNAIKVIAVQEIAKSTNSKKISYQGRDHTFFKALKLYCSELEVLAVNDFKKPIMSYDIKLFLSILRLLLHNIRLINVDSVPDKKINSIAVFSYLYSKNKNECDDNYWGTFLKKLISSGIDVNYGYIFVRNKGLKSARQATKAVCEKSTIINGMIGVKSFFYLCIKFFNDRLHWRNLLKNLSKNWISTLFQKDIEDSFCGKIFLENLYIAESFRQYLSILPKHKCGIYLQENQGWESALNYYWRKYDHGKLYGVMHSTVRFWDLRYADPCSEKNKEMLALFKPHKSLINGKAQEAMLRSLNCNSEEYANVESIRYSYENVKLRREGNKRKILVLGDINIKNTEKLLGEINSIRNEVEKFGEIWVKLHPVNLAKSKIKEKYKFNEWNQTLKEACINFDLVVVHSSSSAIVDAALDGLSVISYLDDGVNLSPLKGLGIEMSYASNAEQILIGLEIAYKRQIIGSSEIRNLFNINKDLKILLEIIHGEYD